MSQIPGYIKDQKLWEHRGIEEIICIAANDPFVMQSWKKALQAEGKVTFLSDPEAKYAQALDLRFEGNPVLGSPRYKRAVLLVDHGTVAWMSVEPANTGLTCTTNLQVTKLLKYLLDIKDKKL
jgi:peroxiredoxin